MSIFEKIEQIEERYRELDRLMAAPEVATDPDRLAQYAQERSNLEEMVSLYREYKKVKEELAEAEAMLEEESGEDMSQMIREEIAALTERRGRLEEELRLMLLPKDPSDDKDVIVEIRAGAGGNEAGLFAADLYKMYTRYAERRGWSTQLLGSNRTGIGGFKEVIFEVKGRGSYSRLKYEGGVHRVQRIPLTESSGRIHTSTATVAVLPKADEVEVEVNPEDLRIDVFRSSGKGGQSVNTTDSAVRITHLPTGIVISCQDERSQLQNRARAMSVLRAKLLDLEQERRRKERGDDRRSQVLTGDRTFKIRTYNFPQNRVTDHRINLSVHRLEDVLDGQLDPFIEELATTEQAELLRAAEMA
jgi:peptide chain release factor 1